jgi:hypothetical protein
MGVSAFGVFITDSSRFLHTNQAHPEPNWPAAAELNAVLNCGRGGGVMW